jgi:hypothetical protein
MKGYVYLASGQTVEFDAESIEVKRTRDRSLKEIAWRDAKGRGRRLEYLTSVDEIVAVVVDDSDESPVEEIG